ncbi:LacI family transcriptional regulator [Murinocardiopsis flavida]|uniref:LacI family transcriptional regulator n=1 Tax=Murinocardiopsis flavida TaxID=645275 RepID=A0A2P8DGY7_9ACTN|nr:LacI family DNA-binding transcriptional regulator [Murinocardiopsis flavida]PSK96439.1 LacI family transcriptional regulator [Murinocardiopsis flavida]
MNDRRRPTLEMVARRAGVGRGTVSRVINGSDQVSEATRVSVMDAVTALGYVPNRAARSLVTQRTDTVALVVSEPEDRLFAQPFFAEIVRGATAELSDRGLQLMLTSAGSESEHERLGDYLSGRHVDGVLAVSLHRDSVLPDTLAASGVPCVIGGRPLGMRHTPLHLVDIDNVGGAHTATRHLIDTGRTRVASLTGPQDMVAGVDRLRGYRKALAESGRDDELIAAGDFGYDSGVAAMRALIEADPHLDGVFVASDLMALAALRTLRSLGRRVPDDVAVVGYDDVPFSEHAEPPLTTIHQPAERMGREMARVLIDRVLSGGTGATEVVLATHLVIRESA